MWPTTRACMSSCRQWRRCWAPTTLLAWSDSPTHPSQGVPGTSTPSIPSILSILSILSTPKQVRLPLALSHSQGTPTCYAPMLPRGLRVKQQVPPGQAKQQQALRSNSDCALALSQCCTAVCGLGCTRCKDHVSAHASAEPQLLHAGGFINLAAPEAGFLPL